MSTETYLPPSPEVEAAELSQAFEELSPTERIKQSVEFFAGQLIVASKLGPTSAVLLEAVREVAPDTPIVVIRHHHETLDTLELINWYERESDFDLRVYDAPPLPIPRPGSPAFAEFQRRIKTETFQKAIDELQPQAYLSGAMRWQASSRDNLPIAEDQGAVTAIRPIADVSRSEAGRLLTETSLPISKTFFDPTKGPDQNLECGLNSATYL